MRDNWGRDSVLTSSEVHFVSLADNSTLLFSKLLKLPSVASRNGPQVRLPQLKVVVNKKLTPREKIELEVVHRFS